MNTITFVSTYGPHFRMNPLLSRKVLVRQKFSTIEENFSRIFFRIKTRLETSHDGLGYNEFSYQLYQAYDWFCLFKKFNCRFQVEKFFSFRNEKFFFAFFFFSWAASIKSEIWELDTISFLEWRISKRIVTVNEIDSNFDFRFSNFGFRRHRSAHNERKRRKIRKKFRQCRLVRWKSFDTLRMLSSHFDFSHQKFGLNVTFRFLVFSKYTRFKDRRIFENFYFYSDERNWTTYGIASRKKIIVFFLSWNFSSRLRQNHTNTPHKSNWPNKSRYSFTEVNKMTKDPLKKRSFFFFFI